MKSLVIGLVVLGIAALGMFLAPLFTGERVSEEIEDITSSRSTENTQAEEEPREELVTVAQGTFVDVGLHNAEGTATLLRRGDRYFVRLEDDFKVTNGPDLYVSFGKDGRYEEAGILEPLKGNEGGQNYEVPSQISAADYNEVWIWCKAFSVGFGKAVLQ